MRNMRKLTCLMLALLLCTVMAVPVFALSSSELAGIYLKISGTATVSDGVELPSTAIRSDALAGFNDQLILQQTIHRGIGEYDGQDTAAFFMQGGGQLTDVILTFGKQLKD